MIGMNIALKPELEKIIAAAVDAGRSSDAGDFVNKAIYHFLVARDLGQEYSAKEMDRVITEGLDDIDRGETIDGEEAFRHLRAYSDERRPPRT